MAPLGRRQKSKLAVEAVDSGTAASFGWTWPARPRGFGAECGRQSTSDGLFSAYARERERFRVVGCGFSLPTAYRFAADSGTRSPQCAKSRISLASAQGAGASWGPDHSGGPERPAGL